VLTPFFLDVPTGPDGPVGCAATGDFLTGAGAKAARTEGAAPAGVVGEPLAAGTGDGSVEAAATFGRDAFTVPR
jgi:hypothetical protein